MRWASGRACRPPRVCSWICICQLVSTDSGHTMSVPRGPPAGGGAGGGSAAAAAAARRAAFLPPDDVDGVGGSSAASLPLPFCAPRQHGHYKSRLKLRATPMLLSLALSGSGRRRGRTRVAANAVYKQI
jgi:hypothetical protein